MQPRSLTFLPPPRWSAVLQAGPRKLPLAGAGCTPCGASPCFPIPGLRVLISGLIYTAI